LASSSQDIIKLKSGDSLMVIVKEVGSKEITYKKVSFSIINPDFKVPKSVVSYIAYGNGAKDFFSDSIHNGSMDLTSYSEKDFAEMGYYDAKNNYKKYKTASIVTFVVSLYSPIIGLVPAFVCSAQAPEYQNLGIPNPSLMSNNDYKNAYIRKAKKIKQQKVWKNWLIPTSLWTAVFTGAFILLNNSTP
jgi:hypothetical protein